MSQSQSLAALEGEWAEPSEGATALVRSVHVARQLPLEELSVEQLRVLVGQREGLHYVLPLALDHLEADPFVSGDLYPGDLLMVVSGIPQPMWETVAPNQLPRFYGVLEHVRQIDGVIADVRARWPEELPAEGER